MEYSSSKPVITVIGDRQTGKTHLALLYAITEAYQGKQVLYTCASGGQANYNLKQAEDLVHQLDLTLNRVIRTNGDYRICFQAGTVFFRPQSRRAYSRKYDLLILDDETRESPFIAERVVRLIGSSL